MDNRPIGIFDSGLGGLTVLREITKVVPNENIIFLGDTAKFPYGSRPLSEVKSFAIRIADFLYKQGVKLIVVACNTATASALPDLQSRFDIPVIGVIEPGAKTAAQATITKRIGVIATIATVNSKAYDYELKKIDKKIKLFSNAAPLLVDYVEKGILDGPMLDEAINNYLNPLFKQDIDVLILGCTHFPLIEDKIKHQCSIYDSNIKVISSAIEISRSIKIILEKLNIKSDDKNNAQRIFYQTGNTNKFYEVGNIFLGEKIDEVIKINLDI